MLEINEAIITAAHGPATYNDSTVATSNSLIATQYIDLQQEIQEALDSNPLLEVEEQDYSEDAAGKNEQKADIEESTLSASADEKPSEYEQDSGEAMTKDTISDDMAMDVTWDEYMSAAPASSSGPMPEDESIYQGSSTETLHEYLMWQLQLTPFSPTDEAIAIAIVEAVDDSGILTLSCEEILESFNQENDIEDEVELDEIEAVLKRIQLFDPVGIAARSLQECLCIQLNQFDQDTPF